ncbi:ATP-binding cassette domain-containing protein [Clostridium sp. C8]|uniref:ABC transporter ATP-binding protein n=1 Tax=Clostridium sp. C8 TaxID=1667357 RepID=UPI00062E76B8|nr:ATP-binding cassette domain-containing protein [Clostridium sp. C8]KLE16322.1 multidrug ABC transporter ATP-binding protein [Clostridium sp. C8]
MNNIIEIKNLSKQFKEHTVLKDVTLNFEKGKIYGLVGRNGSGKTVLMKCICGLIPPSTGEIAVNNKVVGKDIDIPENVGIIIENPGFLPNYSGFNNLKLLSMIKNKINNDEIKAVIKKVGLDPESKKHVGKYSLGMRQRLGLAQAIMENPDIYILDEPMNGLDKSGITEIRNLLLELKSQGKTIIMATHIYEDVRILCDKVYKIEDGEISLAENL